MSSVNEFFRHLSGKPYAVQFVMSLEVEGDDRAVMQIKTYLIPATSEQEARDSASSMIESLTESYRNSDGSAVRVTCLGVQCVEELDYVDDDGRLEVGTFQFSNATRPSNLLQEHGRVDLPLLD